MSPPTEGMPRGAVSACTSFWCGGQRSETPPTSYGCPPFKTCAPASRAARLLSVGSALLSTLQWPPGMGSGPGSLKAPLGDSSFQRDAGAVMRWGASPGGSWSPAPRGSPGRTVTAAAAGVRGRHPGRTERSSLAAAAGPVGAAAQLCPQKGPAAPHKGFQDRDPGTQLRAVQ